jgi:hypothetical protein
MKPSFLEAVCIGIQSKKEPEPEEIFPHLKGLEIMTQQEGTNSDGTLLSESATMALHNGKLPFGVAHGEAVLRCSESGFLTEARGSLSTSNRARQAYVICIQQPGGAQSGPGKYTRYVRGQEELQLIRQGLDANVAAGGIYRGGSTTSSSVADPSAAQQGLQSAGFVRGRGRGRGRG